MKIKHWKMTVEINKGIQKHFIGSQNHIYLDAPKSKLILKQGNDKFFINT